MQTIIPFTKPTRFRSCHFRNGTSALHLTGRHLASERSVRPWDLAALRVTPKGEVFRTRGWFILWYVQVETLEFRSPKVVVNLQGQSVPRKPETGVFL
jgi:hypothetical protein